jgi:hypothetical protein
LVFERESASDLENIPAHRRMPDAQVRRSCRIFGESLKKAQ